MSGGRSEARRVAAGAGTPPKASSTQQGRPSGGASLDAEPCPGHGGQEARQPPARGRARDVGPRWVGRGSWAVGRVPWMLNPLALPLLEAKGLLTGRRRAEKTTYTSVEAGRLRPRACCPCPLALALTLGDLELPRGRLCSRRHEAQPCRFLGGHKGSLTGQLRADVQGTVWRGCAPQALGSPTSPAPGSTSLATCLPPTPAPAAVSPQGPPAGLGPPELGGPQLRLPNHTRKDLTAK